MLTALFCYRRISFANCVAAYSSDIRAAFKHCFSGSFAHALTPMTSGPEMSDSNSSNNTALNKERLDHVEQQPTTDATGSSMRHRVVRRKLGLKEQPTIHDDHEDAEHQQLLWSRIRLTLREPFAEFWGTFFMVFFGNGSVAQVLLSAGYKDAPGGNGYGPVKFLICLYYHCFLLTRVHSTNRSIGGK